MSDIRSQIEELIQSEDVVVFMKGTRREPNCGFSGSVVDILDGYLQTYRTIDVLANAEIRDGVKAYTSWPTIPQVFVRGEFIGGADIVKEMHAKGELASVFGDLVHKVHLPEVELTQGALEALLRFNEGAPNPVVRIQITGNYEYALDFDDARADDLVVDAGGATLLFDPASARRADGMTVDFLERPDGGGFKIENPNEPVRMRHLTVKELAKRLEDGAPTFLFDVRTQAEREIAVIPTAISLADDAGKAQLEALDPDAFVVFACHHGQRSAAAAEHGIRMGFRNVYNLVGGIDAWSLEIDPSVPRY